LGFSPDVDVEADSGSQTVRIVSRADTDEQALAAANAYVDAFAAIRAESMRRSVATALGVVDAQLSELVDRLADVDARLAQVVDPESAVADAIKAERQSVIRDQLDATGRATLLQDFDAAVTGGVRVLDVDAAMNVGGGSPLIRGLFGFVAGAVIALAGIGIAAFADKRVRTMYDVEFAIGDGTFLGSVYTDNGRTTGVGVDAVAALTDRFDRIRVMPVGGSVDPDAFASAVRERLIARRDVALHEPHEGDESLRIVVTENPVDGKEPSVSHDTASTDGTVLLARIGSCTSDALVAAAHAVTTTGGKVIGALLVGKTIGDTRRVFG
jgi:capsular polysaccharide biosynthesis protein